MTGTLLLTDGTTTINLLTGIDGFRLASWSPAVPRNKDTWRDSPLSDGRQLALSKFANAIETYNFDVSRYTQDDVIYDTQELRRLLEQAKQYFIGVVQTPVWIEARGDCETNTRYAVVVNYSTGNDSDPYHKPFDLDHPVMAPWTLIIERQHWRTVQPGTLQTLAISAQQAYNGVTYGQEATSTTIFGGSVFIANKHNEANITHIYYYDASVPAYSANLVGAVKPTSLLPGAINPGDIIYFGCNTAIGDSGPFSNLIFDIVTHAGAITGWAWEYYNGGWVALTVRDDTAGVTAFLINGVNSVCWVQQPDWTTVAINGITAYWVRFRVTAALNVSPPQQGNREVYTVNTSYIEMADTETLGDIQSLLKLWLEGVYGNGTTLFGPQRIWMGLRSYDRGSTFRAYINLADEQNADGVFTTVNAAVAAMATDTESPSGRIVSWTTVGAAAETRICQTVLFDPYIGRTIGKFRCILRLLGNTINLTDRFRLKICSEAYDNVVWQSVLKAPDAIAHVPTLIDFGTITLPPVIYDNTQTLDYIYLRIDAVAGAAVNYELWDLILLPADECFLEAVALPQADSGLTYNATTMLDDNGGQKWLLSDSTVPHSPIITIETRNQYTLAAWGNHITGRLGLNPNTHQRLFFLQARILSAGNNYWVAYPSLTLRAYGKHVDQYLSMRGKR